MAGNWHDHWNPERYNWRVVLRAPTVDLHPLVVLIIGITVGLAIAARWGLVVLLVVLLLFVLVFEYAFVLLCAHRDERARLRRYRRSQGT